MDDNDADKDRRDTYRTWTGDQLHQSIEHIDVVVQKTLRELGKAYPRLSKTDDGKPLWLIQKVLRDLEGRLNERESLLYELRRRHQAVAEELMEEKSDVAR